VNDRQTYKFVIVDDDKAILRLMATLLEQRGHRTVLFHAGTAAVIEIPNEKPDCVITDLTMVGVDGLELVRDLRATPAMGDVKIVMVTSKADAASQAEAEDAGIDGFIGKPFDANTFAMRVEDVLSGG